MDNDQDLNDIKKDLQLLNQKIDTVIKIVSMYDMNIKNILDRTNKIYAYIDQVQKEYSIEQAKQQASTINQTNQIIQQLLLKEEPKIINISPEKAIEEVKSEEVNPSQRRGTRIEAPAPIKSSKEEIVEKPGKKVPVIQRVTDNTGKDLFLADVSVIDEDSKVIHKTKTSATGKWQAHLKPGVYNIHIVRMDNSTGTKLEALQKITVATDATGTMTLPTAVIVRNK